MSREINHPLKILCVCLGNTCRSPAAQYLLQYYAQKSEDEYIKKSQIDSAGLHPTHNGMAHFTKKYLELKGLDTQHFRNSPIPFDPITEYDWILVMEDYMKDDILRANYNLIQFSNPEKFHRAQERIQLFSEMGGGKGEVEDPYGFGEETYFRILKEIEKYSEKIINSFSNGRN